MLGKILGTVAGLFAISSLSLSAVDSANDLKILEEDSEYRDSALERIVEKTSGMFSGSDYSMVVYRKGKQYFSLDFSNIDSFLCSLQSLVGIDGANTLYERRVYDSCDEILISIFEGKNGNVSVSVDFDGWISCCIFKNLKEGVKEKIVKYSKGTGYYVKDIKGGISLEPRVVL